ncbi:MAG: DUF4249 family protein [Candidatus Marinimicrobia bacterium]|nr:DUF4249 family protein [Candidatus Neomarinimicrobiota bacterium]
MMINKVTHRISRYFNAPTGNRGGTERVELNIYLRILKTVVILISTCWHLSALKTCDLPTDPGPMPKKLINTEFEPGLNVFGVLRADSVRGSSFIHVEKALTTQQMYEEADIFDTTVTVQVMDSLSGEVFLFEMIEDTTHRGYYYNSVFQPETGHYYTLEVQSNNLPMLTGRTIVPTKPSIIQNSLLISETKIRFDLQLTADTYQYNCYLFFGDSYLEKQISNNGDGATTIVFNISGDDEAVTGLVIIGYDRNLTEYLNSSPSFIPQTFHEMVNTVENGYGCFGSLAMTTVLF